MARNDPPCGSCHSAATFMVSREVAPGAQALAALSCRTHLSLHIEKITMAAQSAAVTVHVLGAKGQAIAGPQADVAEILERVRRIGAVSSDPGAAHSMEDALYRAVLVMIAHGVPRAAELASAALMTNRYDFERWTG